MKALKMIEKMPVKFGLSAEKKREILQKVFERGGEGLIMKHRDGVYEAIERRPSDGVNLWLKQKKKISNLLGGEDVDAWVSGFKEGGVGTANEGMVGALEFSVYLVPSGQEHIIGRCSNFTREERIRMTIKNPDGTVSLNPEYLGKIGTIGGMDVSSSLEHGSASLVHCTFKRWREGIDAKPKEQCTFPEALLNDAVL